MKSLSRTLSGSLMLAVILFTAIRATNDITLGEDYWAIHTRTFILAELMLTWVCSLAAVLLVPRLIVFARRRGIPPPAEYGAAALAAMACVLIIMLISHSIDPEGSLAAQLAIPMAVAGLASCLYYSFRKTSERERLLTRQAIALEKTRAARLDAELQLLRAQYHPHFLFNMLNTIYVQIDEANEAPRHTIECLSEVLRYQLYSPDEPVEASLEAEAMERYIELCAMRSPRGLRLETVIEAPHGGVLIYPLMLIPLVENAFKHLGGEPSVCIRFGLAADGMLELRVSNSVSPRHRPEDRVPSGLGLANLRRRLGLLYPGGAHSLELSETTERFTAILRLKPIPPHRL